MSGIEAVRCPVSGAKIVMTEPKKNRFLFLCEKEKEHYDFCTTGYPRERAEQICRENCETVTQYIKNQEKENGLNGGNGILKPQ